MKTQGDMRNNFNVTRMKQCHLKSVKNSLRNDNFNLQL